VVLSSFLLLGSGCNPSSVVSSDLRPIDDAIEKDAILHSFDSKPDKKDIKVQTIKTADEHIEKPDDLLSTVEPDDKERENSTNTVGNKDDAVEHHLLLQD
ncbi:secreted protein, partial [Candidatus Thiomargarita nelsonii]